VIRYDLSRVENSKIVRASTGFKLAHVISIIMKVYLMKVGSGDWRVKHRADPLIQQGVVLSDPITHRNRVRDRIRDSTEVWKVQRSVRHYIVMQACILRRV